MKHVWSAAAWKESSKTAWEKHEKVAGRAGCNLRELMKVCVWAGKTEKKREEVRPKQVVI